MAVPFFSVFRHALLRKHHEAVKLIVLPKGKERT